MTVRICFIEWGINPDGVTYARDYAQVWKNFVGSDDQYLHCNEILNTEYNACIIHNDIVFATEEDAVRFILRWS
jgi:hypothetical protein